VTMSYRHIVRCLIVAVLTGLPACQQDMATQPSVRPDEASEFFADGRGSRPLVPGTVARGHLKSDRHLYTGLRGTDAKGAAAVVGIAAAQPLDAGAALMAVSERPVVDSFPFPVTRQILEHGFHRFMIYCVVCHDPLGTGRGMIVTRGYTPPPSLHIDRLRKAPVGHFFDVMTNGYGSMPDYREQLSPRDRWAVAAYLRVLQLSQHFPEKDLTEAMRREWEVQPEVNGGLAP
jgi:mono/diheme cytochrome c family protein